MFLRYRRVLLIALLLMASSAQAADEDLVVFRFATVGDSRAEPGDARLSAQDAIWLQNSGVLARMVREIGARSPQALVFNGDMIYGYATERATLDRQYAFWRGMMAQLLAAGTYVLPVPGNHEVQIKVKNTSGESVKQAAVGSEEAWRANMGDLIVDVPQWTKLTRSKPAAWSVEHAPNSASDGINTDQRQLSYSFDVDGVHMVVINTDPVGRDSSAPVGWLAADFAAARSRGVTNIFVFGHKMAFTYSPGGLKREDGIDVHRANRDAFWDLIEAYRVTYFCGHQHVYHASQPRLANGGSAWQVIVGSGGSTLSMKPGAGSPAADRMYAWVEVEAHRSGRVHLVARGFDEALGPTRLIEEWDIAGGEQR